MRSPPRLRLWAAALAPGILVAATGVGAGDLLTASLAGSTVGVTILWACWVGALLKWFLNEGIARWQMATGTTLLEGWTERLGAWIRWVFLGYLLAWSYFTGAALISAWGVAGAGLLPLAQNAEHSKIIWGVVHALAGLALVWCGGFRFFEGVMSACVALMFVTVVATTLLVGPDWPAVARGLVVPTMPAGSGTWTLGLLGGVGGTVTLLSYGYWIREQGRAGANGLRVCRIDLAVAYALTALFGTCMVIVGSRLDLSSGPMLALALAEQVALAAGALGPLARQVFLLGFWGAVFSSLLGVWQSAPYLFADFVYLGRRAGTAPGPPADLRRTPIYGLFLVGIALVPLVALWMPVRQVQLAYAMFGALFMPLLALTLLIMNNRPAWVGGGFRNRLATNVALVATLAVFAWIGGGEALEAIRKLVPAR